MSNTDPIAARDNEIRGLNKANERLQARYTDLCNNILNHTYQLDKALAVMDDALWYLRGYDAAKGDGWAAELESVLMEAKLDARHALEDIDELAGGTR